MASITTDKESGMKTQLNTSTQSKTSSYSTLQQLGWMVLIWVASVSALGTLAWLMRYLMALAGMVG